jgi:hypothetical protein
MRRYFSAVLAFLLSGHAPAATLETFTGDVFTGAVQLEFGGVLFRPPRGAAEKMDLASIYRVQFDNAPIVDEVKPGVILRNGVRVAGPWGPFNDPVVKFPRRNLTVPADQIAWIVYTPFPAAFLNSVPAGQTGALLPKGDFFEGAVRGADGDEAKVFNAIFGQRTFRAHEMHALVLRDARIPAAQYEVRTVDGSLFGAEYLALDRSGVTIKHALYDNLVIGVSEITEIRAGANRCRSLVTFGELRAEPPEGLQILPVRGFSLATKSVASALVPSGFTDFAAKVAADEGTPPGQRLVFSVVADGRTVTRSSALGAGDPAQDLRLSISGAHSLVLRVDTTGPAGAVDVRGRWIEALFLRQ